MANEQLKREIAGAGIRLWEVAAFLGIADSAFSRKLRKELKPEEIIKIREFISRVK